MQNAGSRSFLGVKLLFVNGFSFFVALFKTFAMQKDDKITLEKGDMQKGSFQRMV